MGKALIGFVVGLLFVPVIAAVIVFTGHFPIQATAKPPRWERRIANLALDPAVERLARGRTSPVTGTEADLMAGMKLYRQGCERCHGDFGKPSPYGRNNFYPPAPQLAERGDRDPEPEIFVVVKYGIRYTGMGGWDGLVPDEDLWRVTAFLHHIKSLPPAVEAAWKHGS